MYLPHAQYLAMPLLAFLLGLALGVSDVVVSFCACGVSLARAAANTLPPLSYAAGQHGGYRLHAWRQHVQPFHPVLERRRRAVHRHDGAVHAPGLRHDAVAAAHLHVRRPRQDRARCLAPTPPPHSSSHITSDLRIPFLDILTALLLVLVPAGLGILLRRYSMVWAKRVAIFASGLGVLFILAALIFGSISETAIWKAPWQLFVSSAILLLLGAAVGYASAHFSGFPRRQARTIALETGIQNSTFTITVLTFSFGGEGQDTEVFNEVLLFPLLYSFFLIVDGILLTALFHYLARFDPEEEKAAYADEEAKRAAELEAEEAGQAGGEGEAQPGEGTQLVVVGAATPTGGESPSAASEGTDSEGKDVEQGTSGVATAGAAAASEDVEEEDLDTGVEGEKGAKAPPAEGDGEGEATSSTTEEVEAPAPGSGDSTRRASAVEVSEETESDNPLASEDGGDVEEWGGTAAAAEP